MTMQTKPAIPSLHPSITPRRLLQPDYPYERKEIDSAAEEWGLNCGPAALCTMLSLHPNDVRPFIPDFEKKRFTSPTMMKEALLSLSIGWREALPSEVWMMVNERNKPIYPVHSQLRTETFPPYGLVRIQFEGPWLKPEVPIKARYCFTHWVGAMVFENQLYIFDVNSGWTSYGTWRDETMVALCASVKRCTGGWHCTHRWQLALDLLDQHGKA